MTHCTLRSRERAGHQTVTGPVTPTCLHDRWGRVEATQSALGEALVMRRRTRVRFPPPPPLCESPGRVTDRGSRASAVHVSRGDRSRTGARWPAVVEEQLTPSG